MNTLKKGDKIPSQWGVLTLNEDKGKGDFVSVTLESGEVKLMRTKELDRLLANSQPQSGMPLKKGDKCQSPWGAVTVRSVTDGSDIVDVTPIDIANGVYRIIHYSELTRIPSHAERMQKMVDTAMDCENTLEPHETVQFTVEAFVEFARHFVKMQDAIIDLMCGMQDRGNQAKIDMEKAEKTLKGEL